MKRFITVASLLALGISGYVAVAQPADAPKQGDGEKREAPSRAPEGRPGEGGRTRVRNPNPENLEGAMKLMAGNLKRLKGQIADASKKDENLKLVNEMERGAIIAKGMDINEGPKDAVNLTKEPDAKDKAAKAAEFRKQMIVLVNKLLTLETQIMDGKTDDASKSVDDLLKFRNENHKAFGVKD